MPRFDFATTAVLATLLGFLPPPALAGRQKDSFAPGAYGLAATGDQDIIGLGDIFYDFSREGGKQATAQQLQAVIAQGNRVAGMQKTIAGFGEMIDNSEDQILFNEEATKLAEMRRDLTQALAGVPQSKLGDAIKFTKIIDSTLLFVDVADRIYTWGALDKNPTLATLGSYLLKKSDGEMDIEKAAPAAGAPNTGGRDP